MTTRSSDGTDSSLCQKLSVSQFTMKHVDHQGDEDRNYGINCLLALFNSVDGEQSVFECHLRMISFLQNKGG